MDFQDQISDEARARMLALFKQRDALELQVLDIAENEVKRINGAHRDLILSQLHSQRAFMKEYDHRHQYECVSAQVNGEGITQQYAEPLPLRFIDKLAAFFGFDLWTRKAKRN